MCSSHRRNLRRVRSFRRRFRSALRLFRRRLRATPLPFRRLPQTRRRLSDRTFQPLCRPQAQASSFCAHVHMPVDRRKAPRPRRSGSDKRRKKTAPERPA